MIAFRTFVGQNRFVLILLLAYLLNPFSLANYFGYILVLVVLLDKRLITRNTNSMFFSLLFFSICYSLFYSFNMVGGAQYLIVFAAFPPIFYLLGRKLGSFLSQSQLSFFLFICAFVFSATSIISVMLNINQGGFAQLDRSLPVFWQGNTVTATVMGSFLTLNMCIPAILISRPSYLKFYAKIGLAIVFVVSLFCALRLGSRTQLGIILITFGVAIFYLFPKQGVKRNVTLIFTLAIGLFLFFRYGSFDLNSDLLTAFASRMEDSNNNIANAGGRSDRWVKSIEYLFSHPLGWDVKEFGLSHNLWFDSLRSGGVICFVLLIIVFIKATLILKSKLTDRNLYVPIKIHFGTYFIGFILLFMVEPILNGMIPLFVFFCLYIGLISKDSILPAKGG